METLDALKNEVKDLEKTLERKKAYCMGFRKSDDQGACLDSSDIRELKNKIEEINEKMKA